MGFSNVHVLYTAANEFHCKRQGKPQEDLISERAIKRLLEVMVPPPPGYRKDYKHFNDMKDRVNSALAMVCDVAVSVRDRTPSSRRPFNESEDNFRRAYLRGLEHLAEGRKEGIRRLNRLLSDTYTFVRELVMRPTNYGDLQQQQMEVGYRLLLHILSATSVLVPDGRDWRRNLQGLGNNDISKSECEALLSMARGGGHPNLVAFIARGLHCFIPYRMSAPPVAGTSNGDYIIDPHLFTYDERDAIAGRNADFNRDPPAQGPEPNYSPNYVNTGSDTIIPEIKVEGKQGRGIFDQLHSLQSINSPGHSTLFSLQYPHVSSLTPFPTEPEGVEPVPDDDVMAQIPLAPELKEELKDEGKPGRGTFDQLHLLQSFNPPSPSHSSLFSLQYPHDSTLTSIPTELEGVESVPDDNVMAQIPSAPELEEEPLVYQSAAFPQLPENSEGESSLHHGLKSPPAHLCDVTLQPSIFAGTGAGGPATSAHMDVEDHAAMGSEVDQGSPSMYISPEINPSADHSAAHSWESLHWDGELDAMQVSDSPTAGDAAGREEGESIIQRYYQQLRSLCPGMSESFGDSHALIPSLSTMTISDEPGQQPAVGMEVSPMQLPRPQSPLTQNEIQAEQGESKCELTDYTLSHIPLINIARLSGTNANRHLNAGEFLFQSPFHADTAQGFGSPNVVAASPENQVPLVSDNAGGARTNAPHRRNQTFRESSTGEKISNNGDEAWCLVHGSGVHNTDACPLICSIRHTVSPQPPTQQIYGAPPATVAAAPPMAASAEVFVHHTIASAPSFRGASGAGRSVMMTKGEKFSRKRSHSHPVHYSSQPFLYNSFALLAPHTEDMERVRGSASRHGLVDITNAPHADGEMGAQCEDSRSNPDFQIVNRRQWSNDKSSSHIAIPATGGAGFPGFTPHAMISQEGGSKWVDIVSDPDMSVLDYRVSRARSRERSATRHRRKHHGAGSSRGRSSVSNASRAEGKRGTGPTSSTRSEKFQDVRALMAAINLNDSSSAGANNSDSDTENKANKERKVRESTLFDSDELLFAWAPVLARYQPPPAIFTVSSAHASTSSPPEHPSTIFSNPSNPPSPTQSDAGGSCRDPPPPAANDSSDEEDGSDPRPDAGQGRVHFNQQRATLGQDLQVSTGAAPPAAGGSTAATVEPEVDLPEPAQLLEPANDVENNVAAAAVVPPTPVNPDRMALKDITNVIVGYALTPDLSYLPKHDMSCASLVQANSGDEPEGAVAERNLEDDVMPMPQEDQAPLVRPRVHNYFIPTFTRTMNYYECLAGLDTTGDDPYGTPTSLTLMLQEDEDDVNNAQGLVVARAPECRRRGNARMTAMTDSRVARLMPPFLSFLLCVNMFFGHQHVNNGLLGDSPQAAAARIANIALYNAAVANYNPSLKGLFNAACRLGVDFQIAAPLVTSATGVTIGEAITLGAGGFHYGPDIMSRTLDAHNTISEGFRLVRAMAMMHASAAHVINFQTQLYLASFGGAHYSTATLNGVEALFIRAWASFVHGTRTNFRLRDPAVRRSALVNIAGIKLLFQVVEALKFWAYSNAGAAPSMWSRLADFVPQQMMRHGYSETAAYQSLITYIYYASGVRLGLYGPEAPACIRLPLNTIYALGWQPSPTALFLAGNFIAQIPSVITPSMRRVFNLDLLQHIVNSLCGLPLLRSDFGVSDIIEMVEEELERMHAANSDPLVWAMRTIDTLQSQLNCHRIGGAYTFILLMKFSIALIIACLASEPATPRAVVIRAGSLLGDLVYFFNTDIPAVLPAQPTEVFQRLRRNFVAANDFMRLHSQQGLEAVPAAYNSLEAISLMVDNALNGNDQDDIRIGPYVLDIDGDFIQADVVARHFGHLVEGLMDLRVTGMGALDLYPDAHIVTVNPEDFDCDLGSMTNYDNEPLDLVTSTETVLVDEIVD